MPDTIDVYTMDLDCPEMEVARLSALLDGEEIQRADRLRFAVDRRRFIVRRGRLRELLSRYLGGPSQGISFAANEFGKPFVPESDWHFSVSHSRNIGLIAIARGRELGCDIEARDVSFPSGDIAERFLSPSEIRSLRALSPLQQTEAFFNCWTRKEAYLKARGCGLGVSLNSFDVSLVPGEPAALLKGCAGWSVETFEPLAGFQAAVVAQTGNWQLRFCVTPTTGGFTPAVCGTGP